jgi:hypothetical protein
MKSWNDVTRRMLNKLKRRRLNYVPDENAQAI